VSDSFSQESPDEACATCPPQCADNWADIDAQVQEITDIEDPLARNQVITDAYKAISDANPENRWAKLASYVSAQAGCAMQTAWKLKYGGALAGAVLTPGGLVPKAVGAVVGGTPGHLVMSALADGNKTIFGSVAPPFMYVKEYGYDSFFACLEAKQPPINNKIVEAMRIMQEGGDLRDAADLIAEYEQNTVVADVYQRHADTFEAIDCADTRLEFWDTSRNQQSIPVSYDCDGTDKVPLQARPTK
jgi:hypothetical protein